MDPPSGSLRLGWSYRCGFREALWRGRVKIVQSPDMRSSAYSAVCRGGIRRMSSMVGARKQRRSSVLGGIVRKSSGAPDLTSADRIGN